MSVSSKLFLIDAIAPFFCGCPAGSSINWSKIPFHTIEKDGQLDPVLSRQIEIDFRVYVSRVRAIGYNAVSVDDVAHMVDHEFYPPQLRGKILGYQQLYEKLFAIAASFDMRVYVNSDFMFFNDAIVTYTGAGFERIATLFTLSCAKVLDRYSGVAGVVMRFGESDGMDVDGDFQSRLVVRSIRSFRKMLRMVLPVFEEAQRHLIVRTWTLGAFEVGDMIWNPATYNAAFAGFDSDSLITSHKYGETDFFRYQNITPVLYEDGPAKIVELQARREYEGFGEFPSFVGFDYERYARYLDSCPGLMGISVWCQTGGWSRFRRRTFVENSSLWVELNVSVIMGIFRDNLTAEKAVLQFAGERFADKNPETLIVLLRLADRIVKDLWYLPEFSLKKLYFRRTRVPPMLWVYWDTITINHTMRRILRQFVHERRESVMDGFRTVQKIPKLWRLARELGIDQSGFDLQYDTFRILAYARQYFLGEWTPQTGQDIVRLVATYRRRHPDGFKIECDFSPVHLGKWLIKTVFSITLRTAARYRLIDRLFLLRFASLVYPMIRMWEKRRAPAFTQDRAMGIQVLFK